MTAAFAFTGFFQAVDSQGWVGALVSYPDGLAVELRVADEARALIESKLRIVFPPGQVTDLDWVAASAAVNGIPWE